MDDDELDGPIPVDEHRLEAFAFERNLCVSTKYEPRGVIWCCWIYIGGNLGGRELCGLSKQKAFDRAMDDLEADFLRRKSIKK